MDGPAAIAKGTTGEVRIAGLRAGMLTSWRVVISPRSTPDQIQHVLFGEGRIGRFYTQSVGARATAALNPSPTPTRIGRPKPKTPKPFVLAGRIVEISANRIVIAEGTIE